MFEIVTTSFVYLPDSALTLFDQADIYRIVYKKSSASSRGP